MSIEAMKQAVEFINNKVPAHYGGAYILEALEQAIAEAEKQEPVDYIEQARKGCGNCSYQYCDYPDCVKRKTK